MSSKPSSSRRLTILYGSQTGTAQDMAEKLYRDSKCYHFSGPVQSMDDYNVRKLIEERLVVFVCSTQGQGDEPDNMRSFWRFLLRKTLPLDSLAGLQYAVLGMGDSSYDKFNFVAKRLNKRLQQLGAKPILPIGLCDSQHDMGFNAVAAPWTDNLWARLEELLPLANGLVRFRVTPRPFRWNVQRTNVQTSVDESSVPEDVYANCSDPVFDRPFITTVLSNERTSSRDHFQDVRLIGLDVVDDLTWQPGDVLLVRPCNAGERVAELFALFAEHQLPFDANTIITVNEFDAEMPVPMHLRQPHSLRTYATQLWNLSASPRPRAFELLAMHSDNLLEREKLIELTTAAGEQDFFDYVTRPRRTILEVLHDFPGSTRCLRLDTVFEMFEPIKARSFSIASCRESGRLDVLVAVVEYRTKLKAERRGLCSHWLRDLPVGAAVRGVIKPGTLRLPADRQTPIVMVGPGTGLAPFRSILQARKWSSLSDQDGNEGASSTPAVLFFGCRNERADFHCATELLAMVSSGTLQLFTAFSRDQPDKIYVQHRILEQAELLRQLLVSENGWFFVSGNSKNMPENVRDALSEALGGTEHVQKMIKSGRYHEETWG